MNTINQKNNKNIDQDQVKEDFCPPCLMVAPMLLGAGTAVAGSQAKGKYQKYRKIMLWTGIITTILSILAALWFLKSPCKQCIPS